jgi:hypothetical protein
MTKTEFDRSTDPRAMLAFLRDTGRVNNRRVRLFSVACCRRIWHSLSETSRAVVLLAERYADGQAGEEERYRAGDLPSETPAEAAASAAVARTMDAMEATPSLAASVAGPFEAAEQARLLRDLVSLRPFPLTVSPSWLAWNGGTVRQLAEAAYQERSLPDGMLDPARLALLGDALEDAGCGDTELLRHLRGPGPNVRGCYAIDLLLGKG